MYVYICICICMCVCVCVCVFVFAYVCVCVLKYIGFGQWDAVSSDGWDGKSHIPTQTTLNHIKAVKYLHNSRTNMKRKPSPHVKSIISPEHYITRAY